jgi:hypothetical protein
MMFLCDFYDCDNPLLMISISVKQARQHYLGIEKHPIPMESIHRTPTSLLEPTCPTCNSAESIAVENYYCYQCISCGTLFGSM